MSALEADFEARRLVPPPGLAALIDAPPFDSAEPWLVRSQVESIDEAFALLAPDAPENLLPIAAVDEESLACVVCAPAEVPDDPAAGLVVRWHLRDVDPVHQAALLDVGIVDYVQSLDEELAARPVGLARILDEIGVAYHDSYISREKRPRDFVVRPIRIACQNVIVGLAGIAQDSSFDGLSVVAWQTCEVPHVATHEANRALAAITLCDAFQNGGTMEIRFDRQARLVVKGKPIAYEGHPEEGRVPASLRRFARTVGVVLGQEDPSAISPSEARELFVAITPMPDDLRARVHRAISEEGITQERLCFSLLSQVWREPELDFLLATSSRATSILSGGAAWADRLARQSESEVCRAAVMTGMLYRRLNATDTAAAAGEKAVRVVEDRNKGVTWQVDEASGSVTFFGLDPNDQLPWTSGIASTEALVVHPRTALVDPLAEITTAPGGAMTAVLVPADAPQPAVPEGVVVLRCPERLADLDKDIERRLLTSRISRG